MHMNPVRMGLVEQAADWRWSSARWYDFGESVGVPIDWVEWKSPRTSWAAPRACKQAGLPEMRRRWVVRDVDRAPVGNQPLEATDLPS